MSPTIATARTVDRDELARVPAPASPRHARHHPSRRPAAALAGDVRRSTPTAASWCRPIRDRAKAQQRAPRPARVDRRAVRRLERRVRAGRRARPRCSTCPTRSTAWSSTSGASPASTRTGTSTATRCGCRTSRSCASPSSAGDRSRPAASPPTSPRRDSRRSGWRREAHRTSSTSKPSRSSRYATSAPPAIEVHAVGRHRRPPVVGRLGDELRQRAGRRRPGTRGGSARAGTGCRASPAPCRATAPCATLNPPGWRNRSTSSTARSRS